MTPKSSILLEVHRFRNKWIVFSFAIKEKTDEFKGQKYTTRHYLDQLKWDKIETHIRKVYMLDKSHDIKTFLMNKIQEEDTEAVSYVDNLMLTIKLKKISSDIYGLLELKPDECYSCYLSISIEEVAYDFNKQRRLRVPVVPTNNNNNTPDNNNKEKTPVKARPDTPLMGKLRSQKKTRRQNTVSDEDSEYKPTNERQLRGNIPEYVPSSTSPGSLDVAMTEHHHEYHPEPLSGSRENLLCYTPSSKKNAKRRKEGNQSPVLIPSTKKKRQESCPNSPDSLAETLDNVSISKMGSSTDLFGSDSENEVKREMSLGELEKKYGEMEPPIPKKRTARPSTSKPKLTKSNSTSVQTSLLKSLQTVAPYKRKERERDTAAADRIAKLDRRKEKIDAERAEIEKFNQFLEEEIEKQKGPQFNEKLEFPSLDKDEVQAKFVIYRSDLEKLIKTVKKNPSPKRSALYTAIFSLVKSEVLDIMLNILHENFPQSEVNITNWCHDTMIADYLMPEWIVMMYRDEHNLEETEARQRIQWASTTVDLSF